MYFFNAIGIPGRRKNRLLYFVAIFRRILETNEKGFFVTAIHTDSGKTLASAILVHALQAQYWKPVQCGFPTDTDQIKSWFGNQVVCHPEQFRLETPASPHFAAEKEGLEISINDFEIPQTNGNPLVVEGAGGLLVPLSKKYFLADLVEKLELPVILVINHYLGALNHGLLTLQELKNRQIPVQGIIFNGTDFQKAEPVLLDKAECPCLLRIPVLEKVTLKEIQHLSHSIQWKS